MDPSTFLSDNIDIINNIAANLIPIQSLVTGAAYVMGLGFAFKGLMSLKQVGESRSSMSSQSSIKEPLVYLLVASMLIFFPTAVSVVLTTTFGRANGPNPLEYSSEGVGAQLGKSIVTIIQTIGIIGFIRGWVLLARAGGHSQQPGSLGKAIMHIFGGILAINIVLTLEIIKNTLYGSN